MLTGMAARVKGGKKKDLHAGCARMEVSEMGMREGDLLFLAAARRPGFELFEEIVALVVYEDESREVFHVYFPDGFHAEFGIFHALDALDGAL